MCPLSSDDLTSLDSDSLMTWLYFVPLVRPRLMALYKCALIDWLIAVCSFVIWQLLLNCISFQHTHTHTHTCILRFNGHFPRWISVASCPLYSPLFITKLHILLYRPKLCMSSLTLFHQVGLGRPLRLLLCQLTTLYSASRPSHVSTFYMSKPS